MSIPIVILNGELYVDTVNGLRKILPHEMEIALDGDYWIREEYNHD